MFVRVYIQIVELGEWEVYGYDDCRWRVKETIEEAKQVNKFREETKKEDVSFSCGVFNSPRYGRFCITYKFVEETEKPLDNSFIL